MHQWLSLHFAKLLSALQGVELVPARSPKILSFLKTGDAIFPDFFSPFVIDLTSTKPKREIGQDLTNRVEDVIIQEQNEGKKQNEHIKGAHLSKD